MSTLLTNLLVLLHLSFLALAVMGIVLADHVAWRWMHGGDDLHHHAYLARVHWLVTAGLTGLIVTGLILFWPLRDYLLVQPLFWLKMLFVLALIINSFFIEKLMHLPATVSFDSLNRRQKMPLYISGAISTLSWLGAASCAILLFRWPFL